MNDSTELKTNTPGSHGRVSGKDHRVEEASIESFPASDPPAYTSTRSGGVDREVSVDSTTDGADSDLTTAEGQHKWAARFCSALSARDSALLAQLLAEDIVWRAGDGPLLVGRDAVMNWQESHVGSYGKVTHRLVDVRGDETALFIESEVMRASGSTTPCHEAMSIKCRNGVAVRVQLYGSVYDPE